MEGWYDAQSVGGEVSCVRFLTFESCERLGLRWCQAAQGAGWRWRERFDWWTVDWRRNQAADSGWMGWREVLLFGAKWIIGRVVQENPCNNGTGTRSISYGNWNRWRKQPIKIGPGAARQIIFSAIKSASQSITMEDNLLTRGKREETRGKVEEAREAASDYFRNTSALYVSSFERFRCTRNNSKKACFSVVFYPPCWLLLTPFRVA